MALALLLTLTYVFQSQAGPTIPADCESCDFAAGFADGMGFADASSCLKDGNASVAELWTAYKDYTSGKWVNKIKALVAFGKGTKDLMNALKPCATGMSDASKYKKLLKNLEDPRFYSLHNGLTLLLNTAEDRHEFKAFTADWEKGDLKAAGTDISSLLLDVLDNPGIPSDNGTEALQIAHGFAEGFSGALDFDCFKDARVTMPALIGGVIDLVTVVAIPEGLEKLFQGLEGLVPLYKDCMADRPEIMALLHTMGDFKHPVELAKRFASDIEKNGVDLALESAAAVMDYNGHDWTRFGKDLGQITAKIVVASNTTTAKPVIMI